jgi:hypothetical protein
MYGLTRFLVRCLPFVFLGATSAGCPPPTRYIAVEVGGPRAPVTDAMVAADCGENHRSARRTDDRGLARVPVNGKFDASRCVVTVAKPGYHTAERSGANVCDTASGCPTTRVDLVTNGEVSR